MGGISLVSFSLSAHRAVVVMVLLHLQELRDYDFRCHDSRRISPSLLGAGWGGLKETHHAAVDGLSSGTHPYSPGLLPWKGAVGQRLLVPA